MSGGRRVFIRVDAGREIGFGHMSRCVTLARQLDADGFRVCLLVRDDPDVDVRSWAAPLPVVAIPAPPAGQPESEAHDAAVTQHAIAADAGKAIVVVDSYALAATWERAMRNAGHRVVAIDDFRDRHHAADLLVSDAPLAFDPRLNSGPGIALTGPAYALIDPVFSPDDRALQPGGDRLRLLISYGGSDPTGETAKAIDAIRLLRTLPSGHTHWGHADIVAGHANSRAEEIAQRLLGVADTTLHHAPQSIAPLLRAADVFLTSGGHSMLESLSMRRVTVVTTTADNQRISVASLAAQQAIVSLGEHGSVDATAIASALAGVRKQWNWHARKAGEQRIFDHLGARRISAAVQALPG